MHVAVLHPLTPGRPEYALLKVGAVGALFALRMALARRGSAEEPPSNPAPPARPHSASRKKRRRR